MKHHCVKSVRIRSYSGPHFPAFGLNSERYGVSLRIQSECGKMLTRITANTDTFNATHLPSEFKLNLHKNILLRKFLCMKRRDFFQVRFQLEYKIFFCNLPQELHCDIGIGEVEESSDSCCVNSASSVMKQLVKSINILVRLC